MERESSQHKRVHTSLTGRKREALACLFLLVFLLVVTWSSLPPLTNPNRATTVSLPGDPGSSGQNTLSPASQSEAGRAGTALSRAPLAFEPNKGQAPESVGFVAHPPNGVALFGQTRLTLSLSFPPSASATAGPGVGAGLKPAPTAPSD